MPYRTVLTLTVLHMEPIPDGMDPGEIYREAVEGEYSQNCEWDTQVIDDKTCKKELKEQGSDPSFFYPEEEGRDLS